MRACKLASGIACRASRPLVREGCFELGVERFNARVLQLTKGTNCTTKLLHSSNFLGASTAVNVPAV